MLSVESGDEFTSIGPKTAPITIVEFSDFQCPYCRVAAISLKTVMQRFPGKVRLVFRNYPLDNSCNRMMQRPLHTNPCEAAKAAYCAKDQGKFGCYRQLFEHQADIGKTKVIDLAKAGGVDTGKLNSVWPIQKPCLRSKKM